MSLIIYNKTLNIAYKVGLSSLWKFKLLNSFLYEREQVKSMRSIRIDVLVTFLIGMSMGKFAYKHCEGIKNKHKDLSLMSDNEIIARATRYIAKRYHLSDIKCDDISRDDQIVKLNMSCARNTFEVTYSDDRGFTDTYLITIAEEICGQIFKKYIQKTYEGARFVLMLDMQEYNNKFIPKDIDAFSGKSTLVDTKLVLLESKFNMEKYIEFMDKYSNWLSANKIRGTHEVAVIMDVQSIENIDYYDLISNSTISYKKSIEID